MVGMLFPCWFARAVCAKDAEWLTAVWHSQSELWQLGEFWCSVSLGYLQRSAGLFPKIDGDMISRLQPRKPSAAGAAVSSKNSFWFHP